MSASTQPSSNGITAHAIRLSEKVIIGAAMKTDADWRPGESRFP